MVARKISIIIPVFNEAKTINEIHSSVLRSPVHEIEKEIIYVDDRSTDGSWKVLQSLASDGVKIFRHEKNKGKGAALRTGFKGATGEIIIIQDADLEYDPQEYESLLEPILQDRADVVYGSRFMGAGPHRVVFFWHYVGNRILTTFSNMATNLNLTDMETCYKVFKSSILDEFELTANRFGFEPEFTAKVARAKKVVYEVGISYYGRGYSEGKKITWRDGFAAIWYIFKFGVLGW